MANRKRTCFSSTTTGGFCFKGWQVGSLNFSVYQMVTIILPLGKGVFIAKQGGAREKTALFLAARG